jgi:hypothetical protein
MWPPANLGSCCTEPLGTRAEAGGGHDSSFEASLDQRKGLQNSTLRTIILKTISQEALL